MRVSALARKATGERCRVLKPARHRCPCARVRAAAHAGQPLLTGLVRVRHLHETASARRNYQGRMPCGKQARWRRAHPFLLRCLARLPPPALDPGRSLALRAAAAAAAAAGMILMTRCTEGTLICAPVNGWKSAEALKTSSCNGGIAGPARQVQWPRLAGVRLGVGVDWWAWVWVRVRKGSARADKLTARTRRTPPVGWCPPSLVGS